MIMQSDKEYKATKRIMLGEATMNPDFINLANFIDQTFGVKPINIIYDMMDDGKRPRLNICFEFEHEEQIFKKKDRLGNFDKEMQKTIADRFREALREKKKYKVDNIWVCYSAFEPLAKIEANEKVSQDKIMQLKKELNEKDLWEISKCFSQITFFLYTDLQVKQFEHNDVRKLWADKYFDLLEAYNEFGYFKREEFNINLDSKENFDHNYDGNWFYYYR